MSSLSKHAFSEIYIESLVPTSKETLFESIFNESVLQDFIKLQELKSSEIAQPIYIAIKENGIWVAQPKENPLCYTSEEDADSEIERLKNIPKYKNKEIHKFSPESAEISNQVNDPHHQGNPRITHDKIFYQQDEIKNKP